EWLRDHIRTSATAAATTADLHRRRRLLPHAQRVPRIGRADVLGTGVMSDPTKTQRAMRTADDRLGTGKALRGQLNKVFPDHWSFMLGEIALYSFLILVLTGTFLTFFFHASQHEVVYNGSYVPLKNVKMSETYESVIH